MQWRIISNKFYAKIRKVCEEFAQSNEKGLQKEKIVELGHNFFHYFRNTNEVCLYL